MIKNNLVEEEKLKVQNLARTQSQLKAQKYALITDIYPTEQLHFRKIHFPFTNSIDNSAMI